MKITLQDVLYTYEHCNNNETTKKMYITYINKMKQWCIDFEFDNDQDLIDIFESHNLNSSQIYAMLGLLRCVCTVCNLPTETKDIVYRLYKIYNKISKDDQLNNRFESKWTVDSLIEFNRTLRFNSYENMIAKLMIGLYTLIPPLRNDYNNVKFVTENTEPNFYNINTGELCIYSVKSKKQHSVIVPDELKKIIADSIVYYPRDYLFISLRGKLYNNNTDMYAKTMKYVKRVLEEDKFTINTFRHLYAAKSFKGNVTDRISAQKGMLHNSTNHLRYGF